MSKDKMVVSASAIVGMVFGGDAEYDRMVVDERYGALIARSIYRMRTERGLTQRELAALLGTTQSVISRLEDADYEGHSLPILDRIATALKYKMRLEFVPEDRVGTLNTDTRVADLVVT